MQNIIQSLNSSYILQFVVIFFMYCVLEQAHYSVIR